MQAADAGDEHRGLVHGPDHTLYSHLVGLLGLQVQVGVPVARRVRMGGQWGTCPTTKRLFTVRYIPHPSSPSLPPTFSHQRYRLPIPGFTYHRLNNPDPLPCALCSTPGPRSRALPTNAPDPGSQVPSWPRLSIPAHSPLLLSPLLSSGLQRAQDGALTVSPGLPHRVPSEITVRLQNCSQSPLPGRTLSCLPVLLPQPLLHQALTLGF